MRLVRIGHKRGGRLIAVLPGGGLSKPSTRNAEVENPADGAANNTREAILTAADVDRPATFALFLARVLAVAYRRLNFAFVGG